MGAVYKAYDKELNRVVALKLVRPELTSDASSMRRFKQELLLVVLFISIAIFQWLLVHRYGFGCSFK